MSRFQKLNFIKKFAEKLANMFKEHALSIYLYSTRKQPKSRNPAMTHDIPIYVLRTKNELSKVNLTWSKSETYTMHTMQ
jgi:hypothetical protein